MSNDLKVSYVFLGPKDYVRCILEQYETEYKYFVQQFNEIKPTEYWRIGVAFYNSLQDQPKKKACYISFLERQLVQDPKDYKNVLRFLNEMKIKLEYQSS